jgi:hypothetical protein
VVSRLQGPAGGVVGIRAGPQPTLPQDDTLRGSVRRPGRKRGRHTGGTAHDTSSVRDSCRARRGGPAGGVVEVRAGPHSTRPPDGTPARALRVHGATNYTTKPVHARYYHRPELTPETDRQSWLTYSLWALCVTCNFLDLCLIPTTGRAGSWIL